MSHAHRRILARILAHPVSANIHLHEVEPALRSLGAEIAQPGHGRLGITLNGHHVSLHGGERTLTPDEVVSLRHLLAAVEAVEVEPVGDTTA